jgi:hypothetical protein
MKTVQAMWNTACAMDRSDQQLQSDMKPRPKCLMQAARHPKVLALLLFLSTAFSARAQMYSIDWYKVAGGGGTSTSGVYSVSGTIGQHDAGGPLAGGNFSLTGGFWSLYAVQTSGAPTLRIVLTSTNTAMVYWPSPSSGFHPQANTDLTSASWTAAGETVQDNGTIKYIIVNSASGKKFYRLKYP